MLRYRWDSWYGIEDRSDHLFPKPSEPLVRPRRRISRTSDDLNLYDTGLVEFTDRIGGSVEWYMLVEFITAVVDR